VAIADEDGFALPRPSPDVAFSLLDIAFAVVVVDEDGFEFVLVL
jgi:hypothetical protein